MSRSTQYIGLNKFALDFVKSAIEVEEIEICTGMFDEPVMGKMYHMPTTQNSNCKWSLKESVQVSPWHGGPMIFTCLKSILVKKSGQEIDTGEEFFRWMIDPSLGLDGEIDYDIRTGRFYV